jgi:thiol:disulfide interchange protein/DsbC/DsbD-like thiol-disulfide interchange protein
VTSILRLSTNRWLGWLTAAIVGVAPASLHAAPVKTQHVEAELISENAALAPGRSATVALRLQIEEGWHTYWRNPGDSGLPTTLDWKMPPGFRAGVIEWPAPKALQVGPLVNYGYDGTVLHLIKLDVPADLKPGSTVDFAARADWLVCKETCIPDGADLKLSLPVAEPAAADARWAPVVSAARAALPKPLNGGWHAEARGDGQKVILTLAPPAGAPDPGAMRFFAYTEGRIEPSAPQSLARMANGAYMLTLPVAYRLGSGFSKLDGVVTSSDGFANSNTVAQAVVVDVPLTGAIVAGPKPAFDDGAISAAAAGPMASLTFGAAVLLALAGGIILNLMPCVFPILSLKALSLTNASHDDLRASRLSGVLFAVGIVLTFVALALVLLTLRAAGEQVGWGFQLQSPAVVTALAALFFILALNLSGVFEFGSLLPGAGDLRMRNRYADALLSGVLAVIIASPCTAPFMGAALGFALAQPSAATIGVFVALGVGMALPFVLLSWFPGWRRVLPRPGAWMTRLKQVLAFPLYATVAWLIWVIGAQVDNDAVVRLLATLLIIAFALWAWRTFKSGAARGWSVAALVAAACALVVAWPLLRADASANASSVPIASSRGDNAWLPYTPARLAELTSSGRAVFVDFTAAWCVTCQVNKRLVLNSADVREAFARKNVALVRADWTRRDPAITRALTALGRNGVPVYVLYRPGREPLLLPEVLQTTLVVNALEAL